MFGIGFAGDFLNCVTGGIFEEDKTDRRPVRREFDRSYEVYCRYCRGRFEQEDYARHYNDCVQRHKDDRQVAQSG